MSVERRVARNAAWLAALPLLMNLLSLGATRYIANRLGVTDFGRFNLGLGFVAMFGPLTHLGLRSLTVRYVPQHRDTAAQYLGKMLVMRTMLALMVAGIAIAAAPLSGGKGDTRTVIAIAALAMVISTIVGVYIDGFQGFERIRPSSVATFVGGMALTIASVVAIKEGGGIRGLALSYVLGPLCTLGLLILWSWRLPFRPRPCWDPAAFAQIFRQASPFFGLVVLDVLSSRVDLLALARVLGEANIGHYTAATMLVERVMYLTSAAGDALLPAVTHLSVRDPAAARPLLRKSTVWLMMASLPIAVLISALAPLAIHLVFGARYAESASVLAIGIWRVPTSCLAILTGYTLLAVKRQDLELRTTAAGTVISLPLLILLIHYYGALGGAVAVATRPLIACLLRLPLLWRHAPRFWPWRQIGQVVAALCLMAIPLAFARSPYLTAGHAGLMLLAVGIYGASLAAMRVDPMPAVVQEMRRRFRCLSPYSRNPRGATGRGAPAESADSGRDPMLPDWTSEISLAVTGADRGVEQHR